MGVHPLQGVLVMPARVATDSVEQRQQIGRAFTVVAADDFLHLVFPFDFELLPRLLAAVAAAVSTRPSFHSRERSLQPKLTWRATRS